MTAFFFGRVYEQKQLFQSYFSGTNDNDVTNAYFLAFTHTLSC